MDESPIYAGYDHRTDRVSVAMYGSTLLGPARVVTLTRHECEALIQQLQSATALQKTENGEKE